MILPVLLISSVCLGFSTAVIASPVLDGDLFDASRYSGISTNSGDEVRVDEMTIAVVGTFDGTLDELTIAKGSVFDKRPIDSIYVFDEMTIAGFGNYDDLTIAKGFEKRAIDSIIIFDEMTIARNSDMITGPVRATDDMVDDTEDGVGNVVNGVGQAIGGVGQAIGDTVQSIGDGVDEVLSTDEV